MQNTDPHSQEYVEHLKDEAEVCTIIECVVAPPGGEGHHWGDLLCLPEAHSPHLLQVWLQGPSAVATPAEGWARSGQKIRVRTQLCKYIYAKDHTDRNRMCTILCHISHHAFALPLVPGPGPHAHEPPAGHLACRPSSPDPVQPHHMVQLSICAFCQGLTKVEHNALLIQSSGRAKELLGQGLLLRSLQEHNQEQEKVELPAGALPPAHKSGTAGRYFTWCQPCSWRSPTWPPTRGHPWTHDQQAAPSPAVVGEWQPCWAPGVHEGTCGRCFQGHEDGWLENLPQFYHQWEDEWNRQSAGPFPRGWQTQNHAG